MTEARTPPRRVLLVAAVIVAGAAWWFVRSYTSDAVRECLALYRQAPTAADTARVDTTLTAAGLREKDPKTCGFRRTSGRWR